LISTDTDFLGFGKDTVLCEMTRVAFLRPKEDKVEFIALEMKRLRFFRYHARIRKTYVEIPKGSPSKPGGHEVPVKQQISYHGKL
jgi:hypothetical protein